MKIMYTPADGAAAYEIDADRHGSYTIRLNRKVIRRVTAVTTYLDRPRWGSRKLESEALSDAKCYLESLAAPDPAFAFAAQRLRLPSFGSGRPARS